MLLVSLAEQFAHLKKVREIALEAKRVGKRRRALLRAWLRENGNPLHRARILYEDYEFECWMDFSTLRSFKRDGYNIVLLEVSLNKAGQIEKGRPSYDALDQKGLQRLSRVS